MKLKKRTPLQPQPSVWVYTVQKTEMVKSLVHAGKKLSPQLVDFPANNQHTLVASKFIFQQKKLQRKGRLAHA